MKIFRKIKNKLILFLLVALFPLSATGVALVFPQAQANADSASASTTVVSGFASTVTIENENFNSSTNANTLSSSFTGWQAASDQTPYSLVTAGAINTSTSYALPENYADRYFLTKNSPGAKNLADNHILMINSKTSAQNNNTQANFGYKNRNSITLDANSFYAFQVSLKGDANYTSYDNYIYQQTTAEAVQIYRNTYSGTAFSTEFTDEDNSQTKTVYVSGIYNSKTYYFEKYLTKLGTIATTSAAVDNKLTVDVFYTDDNFVGIVYTHNQDTEETKEFVYVAKSDITDPVENDNKVDVNVGATTYQSNITYTPSSTSDISGTFKTEETAKYYTHTTEYSQYSSIATGSVYLSGMKDENGQPLSQAEGGKSTSCEFTEISTQNWTTVYFFVATGNTSQSVNLELWLGSKFSKSTGVMFFDDVHASKYSENRFWQTYQNYASRTISDLQKGNISAVKLINLSNNTEIPYTNFDFDQNIATGNGLLTTNWKKSGYGDAQVFDVNDSAKFLETTSYNSVGSNYSAKVVVDENGIPTKIEQNRNALALWAKNTYVMATAQEKIEILANQIYKITADYKLAENSNGSAYMFVEEDDGVLNAYGLNKADYTLAAQTASSAVSSNQTNDFTNNYGQIEFYVKGSALYNSAVKLSVGLGKTDENATGCVVFDSIKVQKATSEDFSSATNKLELGSNSGTLSIANGNFNSVKNSGEDELYKPESWNVESNEQGLNFAGVINTANETFKSYKQLFENNSKAGILDENNPYLWAKNLQNPQNSLNGFDADNIFMFANTTPSWQKLSSQSISLSGTQKIKFWYKTQLENFDSGLYVTLYAVDDNDQKFELFTSQLPLISNSWNSFEIYTNSSSTSNKVILEVSFGEQSKNLAQGFAFMDNFEISSISETTFNNQKEATPNASKFSVVDMSNLFKNLGETSGNSDFINNPAFTSTENSGLKKTESLKNKASEFYIDQDSPSEVYFLNAQNGGTAYVQSKLNVDINAGDDGAAYYALTFKLKTHFSSSPNQDETYGVNIGFDKFSYATGLVSNEEYSTYTIYYQITETTAAKFYVSITCPDGVSGTAVFYFVDATPLKQLVDNSEYDEAQKLANQAGYNVNSSKKFVATQSQDTDEPEETPDDSTSTNNADQNYTWLAIPSIIFGLAILIAVVGWTLRKIKIKKIEIKRKESYDRNSSLHIDVIKRMAEAERAAQAKAVQDTINKFKAELDNLEKQHKERVVATRQADSVKVSKATDKEFKTFAQKRTVIAERLESLNKQLEEINSPEHQLALERKIFAKEQAKLKDLKNKSNKK